MLKITHTSYGPPRLGDRDPKPTQEQLAQCVPWPAAPWWLVRIREEGSPFVVDVELSDSPEGAMVTGIAVRSAVQTHAEGTPEDPWLEGGSVEPVNATIVKRLPLASYTRRALARYTPPLDVRQTAPPGAATPPGQPSEPVTRPEPPPEPVKLPRGRPRRGRSEEFYRQVDEAAKKLQEQGIAPVREIARRKRVSQNLVNQWLFRARHPSAGDQEESE